MNGRSSLILLVEDDPAHAELVRRAFEAAGDGLRLAVAGSLAAAREVLLQSGTNVELVIADWKLPDGEGLDLIRDQQARQPRPVILMTSHGSERIAVEALKAGALDYLVKSDATLVDMPHIADRAIRQWQAQHERASIAEALRRSEERYRHLIEDLPDIIYVIDPGGTVTFVSPAIEREGYVSGDVLGRPFADLFEGAAPPLQADPARLHTVFLNLVENAIKFTPDGGQIVVTVRPSGQGVAVTVSDTGIGIDHAEVAHVFDAFYTRRDTRHHRSGRWEFEARGSGLGLAIVRGHVEARGGSVRVESAGLGQGATFTVQLPAHPPPLREQPGVGASLRDRAEGARPSPPR